MLDQIEMIIGFLFCGLFGIGLMVICYWLITDEDDFEDDDEQK